MQLLNNGTGQVENLDSAAALRALAAGSHVPAGGGKLLVNPQGEPVISQPGDVQENLSKYGYALPTQEQLDRFSDQKTYGEGTANELKAFGLGALRGPTFGLSDVALRAGGVSPKTLSGLKEQNPIASTAGELTGIGASALLAPESLVGKVGQLGEAVTEATAPAALGEGASLAQRIVQGSKALGSKALGSAVEGSIYGLGQSVDEAALGDPNLNAQKVAANVGMGALLGGSLGGALGFGKSAITGSAEAASGKIADIYEKFVGKVAPEGESLAGDLAGAASPESLQPSPLSKIYAAMTGKPEAEVLADLNRGMTGEAMTESERKAFGKSMADSWQEHVNAMKQVGEAGMGEARAEETATLLKQSLDKGEIAPQTIDDEFNRVKGDLQKSWSDSIADEDTYAKSGAKKLESIVERMENIPDDADAVDKFHMLDGVKKDLYDLSKRYTAATRSIPEQEIGGVFKEIYSDVRKSLEDPEIWGEAGSRQMARNSAYSDYKDSLDAFQKKFMESYKVKGYKNYKINGTKINTFINTINDPLRGGTSSQIAENYFNASRRLLDEAEQTQKSAAFEGVDLTPLRDKLANAQSAGSRAQGIIQKSAGGLGFFTDMLNPMGAIGKIAKSVMDPVTMGAKLANIERMVAKTTNLVSRMSKSAVSGSGAATEAGPLAEGAEKNIDKIKDMTSDPQALLQKLEDMTKDSFAVAPKISGALHAMTMRGLMLLKDKLPQEPPQLPFDRPQKPSKQELIKFNRYYEAVHDPVSILKDLQANRLVPEKLEAVAQVYPELYGEMQKEVLSSVMDHVAKNRESIDYQRRLALSKFIGQPLDSTLTPQNFMANQAQFQGSRAAGTAAPTPGQAKSTQKGLEKLSVANRALTAQQGALQRDRA